MGKKRKHSAPTQTGPREVDPKEGKLGPIRTYEDVADSEDEFHINRDKVLLDEGPGAKRRRKYDEDDAFLQPSDEEVLGADDSSVDSDDDDEDGEEEAAPKRPSKLGAESSEESAEENDEDAEGWGSSKRDYYNADNIETEVDALEEEAEAKRLQQKRLQKMTDADFGFDENEWMDEAKDDDDGDVVTEVLQAVEITEDTPKEERLRLLRTKYPEFEFLANEYLQLRPLLGELQYLSNNVTKRFTATKSKPTVTTIKCRALAAYVAALTMYFAVLTSNAKNGNPSALALDTTELRDHSVMASLLQCRELWTKVKNVPSPPAVSQQEEDHTIQFGTPAAGSLDGNMPGTSKKTKKSRKQLARDALAQASAEARSERLLAAEEELADLSSLIPKNTKRAPKAKSAKPAVAHDDDSDFGEEESLSSRALAEKAQKKKSLRFYTSQIAQKANRRADAGRDAGGDADLPYRERLRDRQARLNAEAEKRGKKLDEYGRGAKLGDDSGDEDADASVAAAVRDDEDEYYDMVAQTSSKRKDDKAERYAAIAEAKAAGGLVRVVEGEVGDDGKRAISYTIQKNRGLAPKRKKDVRNPRVKKRKKYEERMKKLSSSRAVYKGGEEKGGYSGEKTGIKTGLVKSIKL